MLSKGFHQALHESARTSEIFTRLNRNLQDMEIVDSKGFPSYFHQVLLMELWLLGVDRRFEMCFCGFSRRTAFITQYSRCQSLSNKNHMMSNSRINDWKIFS